MSQFKYRAFISYSHADRGWGDWLHKALETWSVPARLVGRETEAGVIPKTLAPIFRDRDELPSATDLGRKVNEALAQSANLIVICSPRSAASFWVNEEVLGFKRLGRADRVFCLIVDGEPNASDSVASDLPGREAEECFAPALRYQLNADGGLGSARTEPIAADARPGKDGRTNAKLKLISGLLDVGFDELRQREQQRAHRRLAWVASLAVFGMLITTTLAVAALKARNEAQFQREQAENLVGFMLGNLRDKLNEVNRLDILDEVADHVMGYFEVQKDGGSIASQAKRADALLLVGRVQLDQGRLDEANKAFVESLATSSALVSRDATDPALQVAMADAHLWLGKIDWQRGDLDRALTHFRAASPIMTKVTHAHPDNEEWLTHTGWVHNNLGHILESRGELEGAFREYRAFLDISQRLLARRPDKGDYKQQVADAHDNIGQLMYSRGDLASAEQHYEAECDLLRELGASDPRNNATKMNLAIAETFLAHVAEALGHASAARDSLQRAKQIGDALLADDPTDMDKLGDAASYSRRLARNLRLDGDAVAAVPLLARADTLYAQMLLKSPDGVRAKLGLANTTLEHALLAWQLGDAAAARTRAAAAHDGYAALLRKRDDDRVARLGMASTLLLQGKLDAAQGDAQNARLAWSQAIDIMRIFGADSRDPDQLSVQAQALQLLGRTADARRVIAQLSAMHYRDPEFTAWADALAASSAPITAPEIAQRH